MHQFSCLIRTEPAPVVLAHFGPPLALARDSKRENAHLARDRNATGEPLLVRIGPNRDPLDVPLKASLFVGLALGGTVGLEAAHGPAFWDHPASALARGDQHHPELPFVKPEGQGTNLLAWLAPRFVRLWIGYWCRPINSDRFRHSSSGHQVSLTCGGTTGFNL